MIDIVGIHDGEDLRTADTQTPRATNILSVQIGALEYAPDLGIDLRFFLKSDFEFQNASFKSYLITVLANNGINVASLIDQVGFLSHNYIFNLAPASSGTGFIAR